MLHERIRLTSTANTTRHQKVTPDGVLGAACCSAAQNAVWLTDAVIGRVTGIRFMLSDFDIVRYTTVI